jgi:hypothetical protein
MNEGGIERHTCGAAAEHARWARVAGDRQRREHRQGRPRRQQAGDHFTSPAAGGQKQTIGAVSVSTLDNMELSRNTCWHSTGTIVISYVQRDP